MFLDIKKATLGSILAFLPFLLTLTLANRPRACNVALSALTCLGGIATALVAISCTQTPIAFQTSQPFLLGTFPMSFQVDALSSAFLGLLSLILISIGLFSTGYLNHFQNKLNVAQYWILFSLFVISMCAVVTSADAITFLFFWEIMSLSSAALVACDHTHNAVQKSTFIYLGATRIATAILAGGFLWMYSIFNDWHFSSWSFNTPETYGPAFLILIAFCIKAGIWPFHIWLPYAHPAAPATVSALMSGFMLKIAVYGIIRVLIAGGLNCESLANLAFGLGLISAFWGVLFALVQNDLKRLLAYSSVENVGLILMCLAVCLKARTADLPVIAIMALSAAIFHCINHGIFKTLLFISAGAVDAQAHSRDLRKLGGLAKRMPWTAFCFFVGAFSICSLPPFNGFASKWMLYQSLFRSTWQTASFIERGTAFAGLCVLSAVGGLAIAVFAKAMGVAFLGQSRTKTTEHAEESDRGMIAAQLILGAACVALGVFADKVIPWISRTALIALKTDSSKLALNAKELFPIPSETVGLLLFSFTLVGYFALLHNSAVRKFDTWDCGFGPLSPRTQVSSESFAQPLARIFSPILKYQANVEISGQDRRHFPEHVKVETKMVSLLETRVYLPTLATIAAASRYLVKLQAGSIHLYLLYLCLTLIVLLVVGTNL